MTLEFLLETEGLTKRYGTRSALERLSLAVRPGSICGLLGPNGAGKTTAIRLLLGLIRPTSGRARVFGLDSWSEAPRIHADVGYLPGDLRLYPWLTLRSSLDLFGRIRGRSMLERGVEIGGDLGLEPDVSVRRMSRGMRQKLGLALALAHDPQLLILDEPTSSLDPIVQAALRARLHALARSGRTVLFSSHALEEVESLCDRVVILREGKAVADATMPDLRAGARRDVTIRWKPGGPPAELEPSPFLRILERGDRAWRCRSTSAAEDLLRWLAPLPIADISVGEPDLDAVFRSFYSGPSD